jgi:ABC-type iron transport system FetAB ATPase subunit
MSVLRAVLLVNVFSRTEEKNFNKHSLHYGTIMCYCHLNHGWISIFSGTVADNIRYGPQLRGKKLSDEEVYKLLGLADLDPSFFSKTGGEISVGQAQRVALARTLANKPEVTHLFTQ